MKVVPAVLSLEKLFKCANYYYADAVCETPCNWRFKCFNDDGLREPERDICARIDRDANKNVTGASFYAAGLSKYPYSILGCYETVWSIANKFKADVLSVELDK